MSTICTMTRFRGAALAALVMTIAARTAWTQDDCRTTLSPDELAALLKQDELGAYELPPMSERHTLNVPLTIHIVNRSNGTGGVGTTEVDNTLTGVNSYWGGSGIQFYRTGNVDTINSDAFYLNIDTQAEINALKQTNPVGNTINVYFTANLFVEDGPDPDSLPDGLCGQGSFTTNAVQGVVMDITCTADDGNSDSFAHELGHYFDLFHTHETAMGAECPSGSNCTTTGDLLCDTAADPNVTGQLNGCTYNGTGTRCGQAFSPDPTNLMSYGARCRNHFTEGQVQRALSCLVNLRSNLIQDGGLSAVTWVDFAYTGPVAGSYNQPFHDLWTATHWVLPNGTVVIKPGVSNQVATFDIPCTIDVFRAPATVGQH